MLDGLDVTMWFTDGNHEDHEALDALPAIHWNPIDKHGRVRHVKRGQRINIGGHGVLFFGGAVSVDKPWRTPGVSWFDREVPSRSEWDYAWGYAAAAHGPTSVDIVVAHEVPDMSPPHYPDRGPWPQDLHNAGQQFRSGLSSLALALRPKIWFAGHHHQRFSSAKDDIRFEVMSCDGAPFGDWAQIFDLNELGT